MPQMPSQVQQFIEALVSAPPLEGYLVVGAVLFAIGAWGALIRRNAVVIFMCVELMINGVNLTLVAFADYLPGAGGLGVSSGAGIFTLLFEVASVLLLVALVAAIVVSRRKIGQGVDRGVRE